MAPGVDDEDLRPVSEPEAELRGLRAWHPIADRSFRPEPSADQTAPRPPTPVMPAIRVEAGGRVPFLEAWATAAGRALARISVSRSTGSPAERARSWTLALPSAALRSSGVIGWFGPRPSHELTFSP